MPFYSGLLTMIAEKEIVKWGFFVFCFKDNGILGASTGWHQLQQLFRRHSTDMGLLLALYHILGSPCTLQS